MKKFLVFLTALAVVFSATPISANGLGKNQEDIKKVIDAINAFEASGYMQKSTPVAAQAEVEATTVEDTTPAATPFATTYKLSFDLNGGTSAAIADQFLEEGATPAPVETPVYKDMRFDRWSTTADGNGDTWELDKKTMIPEDVTLYAIWKDAYVITFTTGTNTTVQKKVNVGDTLASLAPEVKVEGQLLAGWETSTGAAFTEADFAKVNRNMSLVPVFITNPMKYFVDFMSTVDTSQFSKTSLTAFMAKYDVAKTSYLAGDKTFDEYAADYEAMVAAFLELELVTSVNFVEDNRYFTIGVPIKEFYQVDADGFLVETDIEKVKVSIYTDETVITSKVAGNQNIAGFTLEDTFEMDLIDSKGAVVAPNGKVRVSFKPEVSLTDKEIKIAIVTENGVTFVTPTIVDGYLEFETDTLGSFALYTKSTAPVTPKPIDPKPVVPTTPKSKESTTSAAAVATGDATNIYALIAVMGLSAVTALTVMRRKEN